MAEPRLQTSDMMVANIRVMVKEKLIDTGRRKLGAIIGDGAHL
jgi:hypothetical protein